MKLTRDTAYLTIAASTISILVLLLMYAMQTISFTVPDAVRPILSFVPIICFTWLMIFVIGIVKHTNEKPFIINAFILYTAYSVIMGLINTAISIFQVNPQSLMTFYQVNSTIHLLVTIVMVVITALLRPTPFKLPLLLFALSELFIMIFYLLVPFAISLIGNSSLILYIRYIGLIYLIVPATGIYIAVTALNVINNQQWEKPFYEMNKPDWPPYDKPNL